MAKRSKKKVSRFNTKWRVPVPLPGTEIQPPDVNQHIGELAQRFIKRHTVNMSLTNYNNFRDKTLTYIQTMFDEYASKVEHSPLFQTTHKTTPNIIDMTDVDTKTMDPDTYQAIRNGMMEYLMTPETQFYSMIPCYNEGFYVISARQIEFQLLEIDTENNAIKVWIRDWSDLGDKGKSPGVSGEVWIYNTFSKQPNNKPILTKIIHNDQEIQFSKLYTLVPPQELHWNQHQIDIWQETVLQNAVDQEARFAFRNTNHIEQLANMFAATVTMCNYLLSKHRLTIVTPKTDQSVVPTEETNTKAHRTNNTKEPSAIRERTIGLVRFISEDPPKRPSKRTICQYKLASWNTRGHIRHYKDGKTVWVKPSVHHRQKLKNNPNAIQATSSVIHIKDNTNMNQAAQ